MKIVKSVDRYLLIIDKNEKLVESILNCVSECKLKGGIISGLGAVSEAELGYFQTGPRDYLRKIFSDEHELVSLVGNISILDGQPFVHVHACLGDSSFQVKGGHLFEAKVSVSVEISIVPLGVMPVRKLDHAIGACSIFGPC